MEHKMKFRQILLALSVLVAGPVVLGSNVGVHIRSTYGQSLTSSTLQWVAADGQGSDPASGSKMPDDAVEASGQKSDSAGVYVCRTRTGGQNFFGSSDGVACTIAYFGSPQEHAKFDVLVNANKGGRVVWKQWDRSQTQTTLVGAVQNGEHYVARRVDADGNVHIGYLDLSVHRGKIFVVEDGQVNGYGDGEVLVEVEAQRYEISQLQTVRHKRKIHSQERLQLAHTILDNMEGDEQNGPQLVASSLSYVINHSVYLGQVKGMNKGLPAEIHLSEASEPLHFPWGLQSATGTSSQLADVSHVLDYATAVNVTVTARRISFDAPYTARLTTVYADQHHSHRQIEGNARQTLIEDIQIEYGPVYFLGNGSLVPLTTTTTSTTSTTTTTTPLPTTTLAATTPESYRIGYDGNSSEELSDLPSSSPTSRTFEPKAEETKLPTVQPTSSAALCTLNSLLFFLSLFIIR
jgi:Protein of unknown function (DUF3421)